MAVRLSDSGSQRTAKSYQPALLADTRRGRRLVSFALFGLDAGARSCIGRRSSVLNDTLREAARTRMLKKNPRNQERMPSTGCTFLICSASACVRAE